MSRAFWLTLATVNLGLTAAGAVYAARMNIPARYAAPIVAAFLLQASFYLVAGFPEARRQLEERLAPARLAVFLVFSAVVPYLLYSLLTGAFRLQSLLLLLLVALVPASVFVIFPVRRPGLAWQDLLAGGTVATAELGGFFSRIYLSPLPEVRLEILGRIMILGLSATAFLSLRRLEGSGFQLRPTAADWRAGFRQFALFLPLGLAAGWGLGFLRLGVPQWEPWMYALVPAATFVGMYAAVALFEELFFRGILQNLATVSLGSAMAAQALSSVAFGLSHLTFREFPNWRFALLSALGGWFYGQAYRRRGSVVASSITHALSVTVWRFLFST